MKKLMKLLPFLLFSILIMTSCTFEINKDVQDPCKYIDKLKSELDTSKISSLELLEVKFNRNFLIDDYKNEMLTNSIDYLCIDNIENLDDNFNETPTYKLFITFDSKEKFVIEVFKDGLVSVFPWDGKGNKEYFSSANIPEGYKLYNYCEFINPKTYK